MSYRIAVDTGGTFTDIALFKEREGRVKVGKVPSTPKNPALAVMEGIKKVMEEENIEPSSITYLLHGTTVATNALLELKGANTSLLTTRGFQDVLEIGRQTRPSLYDPSIQKPPPVVPRDLRFEVSERVFYDGSINEKLKLEELETIIKEIQEKQVESVAICFIHSYRNPRHEELVKEVLERELPHLFISCSSDVLPEFREYERMSTVCINAYVMPAIKRYLEYLEERLIEEGIKSTLYIMQSNGGIITSGVAREQSARTLLSGPAGGVIAGLFLAKNIRNNNIITMDMGGTSLDVSLIYQGEPRYSTESYIGGYPLKLPMIEIHTIGAGGGSIARLDQGGALKVGPESSGAFPGPACYGQGGKEPTVTDANLILGRINPSFLLGGEMEIHLDKARDAVEEKLARPMKVPVEEAAEGILKVVNANMVRGIRVVSVEKGFDPREFSLVAFGGAGPLHALELARELGMKEVIIPPNPGINSALGMLAADVRRDYVLTRIMKEEELEGEILEKLFDEIKEDALKELRREGFDPDIINFTRSADLRYPRQAYEINVSLPEKELKRDSIKEMVQSFHNLHRQFYGYNREDSFIELVNLRLAAVGKMRPLRLEENDANSPDPSKAFITHRPVYFEGEYVKTPVYQRHKLETGNEILGPAVIEQLDSTLIIFPREKARVDSFFNILITATGGF
ncbi:MAG: hydantoinase/oxoprolinase family protein [Candidatus Syntrophonatronum acetioxidans]|uniref:Hydantoinase/oxoprolinase family protein n=1 Tax=Candidatus Syntrophonatronum acetioxidans TaxID=1795816 RepID=A0A424YFG5_9FIRM|nr:MAG: hydantoinase/oxoprolinase family protein [Candidatus Syntrophonatronum acetioxidans]